VVPHCALVIALARALLRSSLFMVAFRPHVPCQHTQEFVPLEPSLRFAPYQLRDEASKGFAILNHRP